MKQTTLIVLLLAVIFSCHTKNNQTADFPLSDSLENYFSIKWKNDSLGQNGFRAYQYRRDKTTGVLLIHDMNLKGFSKERILKLLGKPSDIGLGKEDRKLILTYVVQQNNQIPEVELILYFDEDNNFDSANPLYHKIK